MTWADTVASRQTCAWFPRLLMGFRFRKRLRFGPFALNCSTQGLSGLTEACLQFVAGKLLIERLLLLRAHDPDGFKRFLIPGLQNWGLTQWTR